MGQPTEVPYRGQLAVKGGIDQGASYWHHFCEHLATDSWLERLSFHQIDLDYFRGIKDSSGVRVREAR